MKYLVILVAVFGLSNSARAQVPLPADGTTLAVLAQLAEQVKTTAEISQMLLIAKKSMETARATSEFISDMAGVANNFKYLQEGDPSEWFDLASQAFFRSFPEFQAFAEDAVAIRNNLESAMNPQGYDPYALQSAIRSAIASGSSAYQTLVAVDETVYNMTGENLQIRKNIDEVKRSVIGILAEVNNPLGMTAKQSSALTAKAAAQNAAASVEAAELLNEQTRLAKIKYLKSLDASARQGSFITNQMTGFDELFETMGKTKFSPFEDLNFEDGKVENYRERGEQ